MASTKAGPLASGADEQRPVLIGLYGVSGCGKSYLSKELKDTDEMRDAFDFHDGSDLIAQVCEGGTSAFRAQDANAKNETRKLAINFAADQCKKSGKAAVITGHWILAKPRRESDTRGTLQQIGTDADLKCYTHMVYLKVDPELIAERRSNDAARARESYETDFLRIWQDHEIKQLRDVCLANKILFTVVDTTASHIENDKWALMHVAALLSTFAFDTEKRNLAIATDYLDSQIQAFPNKPKHAYIFDGDRTLAAGDTGKYFWAKLPGPGNKEALDRIYKTMGYTYLAFRQAMLLHTEVDSLVYETVSKDVVGNLPLNEEVLRVLRLAANCTDTIAVIITCGQARVWDLMVDKFGLTGKVIIVGAGFTGDSDRGFIVTPELKADLIKHIKAKHDLHVSAFGDSQLDIPMLCEAGEAGEAFVVVGDEKGRSKSMDVPLHEAIKEKRLRNAHQILVGGKNIKPRLNTDTLPIIDPEIFATAIPYFVNIADELPLCHATTKSVAKILMSDTRNAEISGPALRNAHGRIGFYLANEYLSQILGLEEYPIQHVQGNTVSGHRIKGETATLIVPLMRGGEPMAMGVSDALPTAAFLHAKVPEDLRREHIIGMKTIILVDSVINTGKSIIEFYNRVRELDARIRVVVVAGVVQKGCVTPCTGSALAELLRGGNSLCSLVALRVSDNGYKGHGGTDTGHRLFNTTYLED